MEKSSIKKVNVAGTVGYVISILIMIATIAGMVITAIAAAAAISVSDDEVKVAVSSNYEISATGNILNKLNSFMKVGDVKDLNELLSEENNGKDVNVNDKDISYINVNKTENGLEIKARSNEDTYSIKKILFALIVQFLLLASITVALHMVNKLMKALKKCETPFSDDVIKYMNRFAYSLIPAVVLNMLTSSSWDSIKIGTGFDFSFDVASVFLVVIVFVLVIIFKYGAQLQKESDETL